MPDNIDISDGLKIKAARLRSLGICLTQKDEVEITVAADRLARFMHAQRDSLGMLSGLRDYDQVLRGAISGAPISSGPSHPKVDPPRQRERVSGRAQQAVEASLEKIATSELGALSWLELDRALACERARRIDQKPEEQRGILYGYTLGVKDMFDRIGRRAGWGAKVPVSSESVSSNADVIDKIESADGIILGHQHMAEFAMSPTGFNEWHWPGRSPLDVRRVSGGSSSGAGMSVGDRHVRAAIGSDTGGSIRLPAACCGVVGLKPTQYAVSSAGSMPLSPSLDCIGPLGYRLMDCVRAFAALTGDTPDEMRRMVSSVQAGAPGKDFTVAMPRLSTSGTLSPRALEAVEKAAKALMVIGIRVIEVPLPDMDRLNNLATVVLSVEAASCHQTLLSRTPENYGCQVYRRLIKGLLLSGTDYFDAIRLREAVLRQFLSDCLGGAQALLLPTLPDLPPLVDRTINRDQNVLEQEGSIMSWWTRGINYLGVPALSMPVDRARPGEFPFSIQLVGHPHGEQEISRIGYLLENYLSEAEGDSVEY